MPDIIDSGMEMAREYYSDYGQRTRELKAQGQKIAGYLCAYVPLEIISAAGLVPYRIRGRNNTQISDADAYMETIVCSRVRRCYDFCLKDKGDLIDALIIPHACDSMACTYSIWQNTLQPSFSHFIDIPHTTSDDSLLFFSAVLESFRNSLSKHVNFQISDDLLFSAIDSYNNFRQEIQLLYGLRQRNPQLISGSMVHQVLIACMSLPVDEATALVRKVIEEAGQRRQEERKALRILLLGAGVDDSGIFELVENLGATIVADDVCPGAREFQTAVRNDIRPIDALAERYLRGIYCARTYRKRTGTYAQYLDARFGEIGRFLEQLSIDGVIAYFYRCCDPFGFEVPALKQYIASKGKPLLYIEDEYMPSTAERLRTRVQAFLETLKG